jgi:hypothetical protein
VVTPDRVALFPPRPEAPKAKLGAANDILIYALKVQDEDGESALVDIEIAVTNLRVKTEEDLRKWQLTDPAVVFGDKRTHWELAKTEMFSDVGSSSGAAVGVIADLINRTSSPLKQSKLRRAVKSVLQTRKQASLEQDLVLRKIAELEPSRMYCFRLRFVYSFGFGLWSPVSNVLFLPDGGTARKLPDAPAELRVSMVSSDRQSLVLEWRIPSSGAFPIIHYNIERSNDGGATWTVQRDTLVVPQPEQGIARARIEQLNPRDFESIAFRMFASSVLGSSDWSETLEYDVYSTVAALKDFDPVESGMGICFRFAESIALAEEVVRYVLALTVDPVARSHIAEERGADDLHMHLIDHMLVTKDLTVMQAAGATLELVFHIVAFRIVVGGWSGQAESKSCDTGIVFSLKDCDSVAAQAEPFRYTGLALRCWSFSAVRRSIVKHARRVLRSQRESSMWHSLDNVDIQSYFANNTYLNDVPTLEAVQVSQPFQIGS